MSTQSATGPPGPGAASLLGGLQAPEQGEVHPPPQARGQGVVLMTARMRFTDDELGTLISVLGDASENNEDPALDAQFEVLWNRIVAARERLRERDGV